MSRTLGIASILLLSAAAATAQSQPPCTPFTVITRDTLNNIQRGFTADDVKWFHKDLAKKYPGACYAAPAPMVAVVFYVTVTPAVYRGTRVVDQSYTQLIPIIGTVTDENTNTSDIAATAEVTTANSVAVPYSFDYGIFTLTVERRGDNGKFEPAHIFQQSGLAKTLDGIPLGGRGRHPAHAVIEDAVKWLNAGGLTDPNQSVLPPARTTRTTKR